MRQQGRRGARLEKERKAWRQAVTERWGTGCIWPVGDCYGPIEIAHGFGKGAHPELHTESWNGFPLCVWHHRLAPRNFEFTPILKNALQAAAEFVRDNPDANLEDVQWVIIQEVNAKCDF